MGLFAAIGGVIATVGGWISAGVSAVGNFFGGLGGTIGEWASKAFECIKTVAGKVWEKLPEIVKTVSNIIHSVLDALGIKSEEDPAILAYKAQMAEKSVEDFDGDTIAYIEYLKNEIKISKENQEIFDKLTPHEKAIYSVIGTATETRAIEQKTGLEIPPEVLPELYKIHESGTVELSGKVLLGVMTRLKEQGITNIGDVVDYLKGEGDGNTVKTGDALETALKEQGIENAEDVIADCQTAVRKEIAE